MDTRVYTNNSQCKKPPEIAAQTDKNIYAYAAAVNVPPQERKKEEMSVTEKCGEAHSADKGGKGDRAAANKNSVVSDGNTNAASEHAKTADSDIRKGAQHSVLPQCKAQHSDIKEQRKAQSTFYNNSNDGQAETQIKLQTSDSAKDAEKAQDLDTIKDYKNGQGLVNASEQTDIQAESPSLTFARLMQQDPQLLSRYIEDTPQVLEGLIANNPQSVLRHMGSDTDTANKVLAGLISDRGADGIIGAVAASGALSALSGEGMANSVKSLCNNTDFLNAVLTDERVRAEVIAGYLKGLASSEVPRTIPVTPSAAFAVSAPARPKSLSEAADMARKMIKLY